MSLPSQRRRGRQAEAQVNDRRVLDAAREVFAAQGADAPVAAVARQAGVGIGSLYRRYRTKEALFQHLALLSLEHWNTAGAAALAEDDPWHGLAGFVTACAEFGQGTLGSVAGTITVTEAMATASTQGDGLLEALVHRGHEAGVVRPDVTAADISLLIEQLGRSPLLDQLRRQGRVDLLPAAEAARRRLVAIAVAGLRPPRQAGAGPSVGGDTRDDPTDPLPGEPPSLRLFTERWARSGGEVPPAPAPGST